MSTLLARKLASQPFWLPRGATEYADFTSGLFYGRKRRSDSIGAHFAAMGFTFARGSEASHATSTGTITFAAADVPRLAHDAATLAPLGLLLEGTRTNLQLYSTAFDTSWNVVTGIAVTADVTTAPDGTTTADKLSETAITNAHIAYRAQTLTGGITYTRSCFAKQAERQWCGITFDLTYRWFKLSDGTIGSSGAGIPAIQPAPSGFYRCSVTSTPSSTGSRQAGIKTAAGDNSGSYLGVAGNGIYAWGYQLEAGAFASSFIRTTTAAVTRAADSLTRTIVQPARLAMTFQVRTAGGLGDNQTIWSIGDATDGVRLYRNSTGHIKLTVTAAGSDMADLDAGGVGGLGVHKIAVALDGSTVRLCLNGGDVVAASAALPALATLTERFGSSAAGEEWFGHLQSYASFGTLSDGAMLARTAPPAYVNALIGIDSLSDPVSTGVGRHLRDVMWSRIGKASAGWVPLIYPSDARVDGLNYSGVTNISLSSAMPGDDRTLDFQGQRWQNPNASTAIGFFTPREPYDQLDMIYVSNPSDGSFRFQSLGNGATTIDADAALAAHAVHVECFAAPNASVRWDQFETGNPNTIVGVNFSRAGAGGFTYNPFGNGGWKVQWLAAIDDAAMRTIIGAIKPTHFLFNGGMNDRVDRTASQFDADCRKVLNNVLAAAPRCKIVIVQSLAPASSGAGAFFDYVPVKQQIASDYGAQFLDQRLINANTATFVLADAAGYMADGVHPTQAFNSGIAAPWLADNVAW